MHNGHAKEVNTGHGLTVVVNVVQAHDRLVHADWGHGEGLLFHHGHVHQSPVLVFVGVVLLLLEGNQQRQQCTTRVN